MPFPRQVGHLLETRPDWEDLHAAGIRFVHFSPRDQRRSMVLAEKMGLGYDDLSALNTRLVYCSISGYGDFGPYRDRMAYDAVMQGMTGFAVMQGSKAPGLKPGSASDGPVRDSSPEMLNSLVVDKITSCESATVCQSGV